MEIKTTQEIYNESDINYNQISNANKKWVAVKDIINWIDEELKYFVIDSRPKRSLNNLKKTLQNRR